MRTTKWLSLISCFALVLSYLSASHADELAEQGRAILDAQKSTVVTVKMLVKISGGGQAEENPTEVTGTVIDSTGLTVLSLSATDPTAMLSSLLGGMGGGPDFTAEVTDVKILTEDGTEVESEIILRDKDLDLAFVRPVEKPETPWACVDVTNPGQLAILDPAITLNRMGKVARRAYSASIERIDAIVERPRLFYIPGSAPTSTALGSPAFTVDGSFVGMCVMRTIKSEGGGFGMMSMFTGGKPDNMAAIIVPVADILEAAEQAPPFGAAPATEAPAQEEPAAEDAPAEAPTEGS